MIENNDIETPTVSVLPEDVNTRAATKYPVIQSMADEIGESVYETLDRLDFIRFRKMVNRANEITNPSPHILTIEEVMERGNDILDAVENEADEQEVYSADADVIRVMFGWDVLDELDAWQAELTGTFVR